MSWLHSYCADTPSVLSASVPHAFSSCFNDAVLQLWDVALFLIVTLALLCLPPTRTRVAFHPPHLPSFQRTLLLLLATLPLVLLLSSLLSQTATPSHAVALLLRCLTFSALAILLPIHTTPSRHAGYHVIRSPHAQWLQAFILLSLISTAFAAYDVLASTLHRPVITAADTLTILTTIVHTALALTAVSALSSFYRPHLPRLPLQPSSSHSSLSSLSPANHLPPYPPDIDRGLLSSFTFAWVSPTIRLGVSQGFLHLTDVPPLPASDSTPAIAHRFALIWRAQTAHPPPSLLSSFWALLGPSYLYIGLLKFVSDLTVFIGPILLNFLVTFLSSQSTPTPEPALHGYLYALGLIAGVVLSSVLGTQYTYRSRRMSMRVRSAIVSLVYSKALSISGMAKRHFSSGQVTNIMSVDTERVMDICTSFHDFWSLPVQIAVALYLLHAQVGLALLAGLAIVLLLIPINALLTKKIAAVSRRMMHFKDKRVQLTNELLHQIRTIKLLALEGRFEGKIKAVRRREMGMLRVRKYLDALCVYFWATTPILVSLATFSMYALLGHQLTAARVFTSLALFNTLIRPLNSFPWVINGLVEGRVSALRVYRFLCAEDRAEMGSPGDAGSSDDGVTVQLQGSFAYQKVERSSGTAKVLSKPTPSAPVHAAVSINGSASKTVNGRAAGAHQKWLRLDQDQPTPPQQSPLPSPSASSSRKKKRAANGHARANGSTALRVSPSYVFHLEDVSLRVGVGEFVGICGPVGSGKSSLLLAMLGELWGMKRARLPPRAFVRGRVAYVAQEAWIQNATLRDNVLFGLPYDEGRYTRVLDAVALQPDLKQLPAGDLTEIGEGGINLSGGQKVRVSIARAAYADCDVYLLDDILSAVDVHVGWHLISRLVHGLLANATVCLVTHHTHFLQEADQIIQMKAGRISHTFTSEDSKQQRRRTRGEASPVLPPTTSPPLPSSATLESAPESLVEQLKAKELEKEEEERLARLTVDESRQRGAIRRRVLSVYLAQIGWWLVSLIALSMLLMQASRNYNDFYLGQWAADTAVSGDNSPDSPTSSSSSSSISFLLFPSSLSFSHSLHSWAAFASRPAALLTEVGGDASGLSHLRILAFIALFNSLSALFRAFIFAYGGLIAAGRMFDALLTRVLYARVGFFDENPVGRILNRFSTDMYSIDENIPFQGNIFLAQTFLLIGALVVIAITTPLFLLIIPPLGLMYVYMQRRYRATSRELRRLDSVTRSPIYSTFSETLSGVYTVRAFGATQRFLTTFAVLLDTNQRVFFLALGASQWLNIRLQVVGVIIIAFLCLSAILLSTFHSSLPALPFLDVGLVGLAIAYALPLTDTLNQLIGSFTDTEKEVVSVERTIEYLDIKTELDSDSDDDEHTDEGQEHTAGGDDALTTAGRPDVVRRVKKLDDGQYLEETLLPFHRSSSTRMLAGAAALSTSWPSAGAIEFDDVTLIYRRGLRPALSHVSFRIEGGAHVGVVGRTGAGKSSLLQVLLRMRKVSGGRVLVDGVDVADVDLPVLRRRLCVIPQSPVLFTGSVRDNVDVFGEHADSAVWRVLEQCQMAAKVRTLPKQLHARVGEYADHFSIGQRQLLCFGRALLQQARVVMLDEASASLDAVSDAYIQALTAGLKGCTVMVIAHRIHTVMGMDRVMVVDGGRVAELDTPQALMQREGGLFRSLVEQSRGKEDSNGIDGSSSP